MTNIREYQSIESILGKISLSLGKNIKGKQGRDINIHISNISEGKDNQSKKGEDKMTKNEKLKVYRDVKSHVESLGENECVDFCHYDDNYSVGFLVERLQDDELGKLFTVDDYLMRNIPEMIAMSYRHIMSNQ